MRSLGILACLLVLPAACSEKPDAEAPDARPPLDAEIEGAIRDRLVEAIRDLEPSASVVLTDETPRLESPDKPVPGTMWVFLRGASVYVPLAGLDDVDLADRGGEGLELRLGYGRHAVRILDATRSAGSEETFVRLKTMAADFWQDAWGDVEATVRAGTAARGTAEADVDARLDEYRRSLDTWNQRLARSFDSIYQLRRMALRARPIVDDEDLFGLYRTCRLLHIKRNVMETVGGSPESPLQPVASGPTEGLMRVRPGTDGEIHARLDGPQEMAFAIHATGPEDRIKIILGSIRPYAGSASRAAKVMERAPKGAPGKVLAALSALHLDPKPGRGDAVAASLAGTPSPPPDEDRKRLEEALEAWAKQRRGS